MAMKRKNTTHGLCFEQAFKASPRKKRNGI